MSAGLSNINGINARIILEPSRAAAPVTKSDATVLAPTRALFIGGTGDVAVVMADASTPIFTSVPAGSLLPISVTKVLSTGTSATNIIALF